jgi:hypothetical protein
MPALCPRIDLRVEATAVADQEPRTGVGSLGQVLRGLHELAELGAEYVLFDIYLGWECARAGSQTPT